MSRRAAIFCVLAALSAFCAYGVEAERVRRGGERLVSNWHIGPFFEYRRAESGAKGDDSCRDAASFWAVRPFYSQVRDPATTTSARDVLWPLFTKHDHADRSWWSALVLLYGDSRINDPSWSFNVYPFWFSGADRKDEGYWGFFPFYGHHPHFLLTDDLTFAMWPIWHTYEVKGVRSHAVCWPFVTWRDEPRAGWGIWPFYGRARLRESSHSYALWPLVTWASYDEDRDTSGAGHSWWCLPFYGEVRRKRESQTMILPPFFSYAELTHDQLRNVSGHTHRQPPITNHQSPITKRWRLPWPFVDFETSPVRDRISVWPIWEQLRGYSYNSRKPEERTWRFGWKLIENTELETDRTLEKRFNFFPFFTWERRWIKIKNEELRIKNGEQGEVQSAECRVKSERNGEQGEVQSAECRVQSERNGEQGEVQSAECRVQSEPYESYLRIWPFWSSETAGGRTRQRTLELMPFRHSEGIERNWAPFWSLWERDERPDGRTRHSLLWNFISWF